MDVDNHIQLGVAEVDITPDLPMRLVGMGRVFVAHDGERVEYSKRDNPATETHDPLMLQATCLRQGDKKVVMINADLLYTVALEGVRAAVAHACGIPVEAVFYAATHNHNGPCNADDYPAFLCERAAECARQAMASVCPVEAEHAHGNFDRLSYDRAEPWGNVDGSVDVVRFTEVGTGKLVSMWWNHGCHPCSLSWDFNEFSADYPGVIRRRVSEAFGEGVKVSFLHGCSGNVQPSGLKRFVDPPQMYFGAAKGDFEMVERMGDCIVEAGLSALKESPRRLDLGNLQFEKHEIELPIQAHCGVEELRGMRERFGGTNLKAFHESDPSSDLIKAASGMLCEWLDELIGQGGAEYKTHTISGGIVSLGDLAVLFTPLELAWQIGARVRERSTYPVTLFSTTSLGFESYLTESKFYELEPEKRPYEAYGLQSMAGFSYTPESPSVFENAVVGNLQQIMEG